MATCLSEYQEYYKTLIGHTLEKRRLDKTIYRTTFEKMNGFK